MHQVEVPGGADASLLLKPAWIVGDTLCVKIVTFFPDNGRANKPAVNSACVLFDATDGTLIGLCAANELTTRRTAAASAIAAKHLARGDARRLLIVGAGALAPVAAQAHTMVRNYERIEVWGRRPQAADAVTDELRAVGLPAVASTDLDESVASADVVCCVTSATAPLVRGTLLRPGTHLDLVGGFAPHMRETDDEAIRRASIFVDTVADALKAGDLSQPLADGLISRADVAADLVDLITRNHRGRANADEITLFKSVGLALEDLAAAKLAF
ncbi:MAG: ornithine cyclodeaminase family protein [Actinobacteria bacterium]|nr:ornithine cyclodeaminase family protein [Actinomycetota bacterium]